MMSETALVIINMQSVRASKETDYYLGNMHVMLEKMNYLIAYAREMGYKIIFVKHLEPSGAFSERSPLSEFFPDLDIQEQDTIIEKKKISAYYQTQMESELSGIKNLVVCGALTNLCVRMFVEESYDRGFRIAILEDLTACFSSELQEMTLEDLYTTRSGLNILTLEKFVE
ncbi:MAG: cysteine hydrolase [candidate division SR1 bacterium]|nr:cysteine hydrolase [candidate division SR1 bacterium]